MTRISGHIITFMKETRKYNMIYANSWLITSLDTVTAHTYRSERWIVAEFPHQSPTPANEIILFLADSHPSLTSLHVVNLLAKILHRRFYFCSVFPRIDLPPDGLHSCNIRCPLLEYRSARAGVILLAGCTLIPRRYIEFENLTVLSSYMGAIRVFSA